MTSADYNAWHTPVLLREVIEALRVKADGLYVDMTAGGGGHSAAILEKLGCGGKLIALDRDREALEASDKRLSQVETEASYQLIHASFSEFPSCLEEEDRRLDGLLADLGVSSHQLDRDERGFSYLKDGPLDMRMNQDKGMTAAELLADISEEELIALLRLYGEERYATSIARAIVRRRKLSPITRTTELTSVVAHAVPSKVRRLGNPARQTFQALRMAVNREQQELAHLLHEIPEIMKPRGRVVLISFHSLEDRMVKQAMRRWQSPCECPPDFPVCTCGKTPLGKQLTTKPLLATEDELDDNPRSRSAKMRAFEFLGGAQ